MLSLQCCFLSLVFLQPRSTATPTPRHATNLTAATTTAKAVPKFLLLKRKLWKTATNSAKSVQKKKRTLLKKAKSRFHLCQPKLGPVSRRPFLFVPESEYSSEIFDCLLQSVVERNSRFPVKQFFRQSYIRLSALRIVAGKRHIFKF